MRVSALARRTWATSQQASQLLAHLEWWRADSHFVRPHESLRVALVQPPERGGKLAAQRYRQRTPAMAAGRTHRQWTAREVLSCPLPSASARKPPKPEALGVSCREEASEGASRRTQMEPRQARGGLSGPSNDKHPVRNAFAGSMSNSPPYPMAAPRFDVRSPPKQLACSVTMWRGPARHEVRNPYT